MSRQRFGKANSFYLIGFLKSAIVVYPMICTIARLACRFNLLKLTTQVGKVSSSRPGPDDSKTLAEIRFVIGDYLDIAILQPSMMQGRQNW